MPVNHTRARLLRRTRFGNAAYVEYAERVCARLKRQQSIPRIPLKRTRAYYTLPAQMQPSVRDVPRTPPTPLTDDNVSTYS